MRIEYPYGEYTIVGIDVCLILILEIDPENNNIIHLYIPFPDNYPDTSMRVSLGHEDHLFRCDIIHEDCINNRDQIYISDYMVVPKVYVYGSINDDEYVMLKGCGRRSIQIAFMDIISIFQMKDTDLLTLHADTGSLHMYSLSSNYDNDTPGLKDAIQKITGRDDEYMKWMKDSTHENLLNDLEHFENNLSLVQYYQREFGLIPEKYHGYAVEMYAPISRVKEYLYQ